MFDLYSVSLYVQVSCMLVPKFCRMIVLSGKPGITFCPRYHPSRGMQHQLQGVVPVPMALPSTPASASTNPPVRDDDSSQITFLETQVRALFSARDTLVGEFMSFQEVAFSIFTKDVGEELRIVRSGLNSYLEGFEQHATFTEGA